jgi:twitching motility protein PilT
VLATLHTHDAAQSIRRLMAYVPVHQRQQLAFDLSLALVGVLAQRLVPRADGTGRVLASEVITLTPPARKLLANQDIEGLQDLITGSRSPELRSFNRDLLDLMKEGQISFEAGLAASTNKDAFALHAQGMATGSATFSAIEGTGTEMDMKALLSLVVAKGASDLHLCVGRPPILRQAGKLQPIGERTLSVEEMRMLLFSVMSGAQRSRYELERDLDFALAIDTGKRFRVNAYFQRGQMAASLRIINDAVPSAEELGLPRSLLELGSRPHGLLLVVGPTGSGKSTTLACLVDRINRSRPCRIVTVEDPIEYGHGEHVATVDLREIGHDSGSFAQALRYVLRQDPDVILVGEKRDLETIGAALTAAETGHLV